MHKFFRTTGKIQLRKFRFKEGVKLIKDQCYKLISFIYNELCEASLWPITLTVFSNAPEQQISKDVFKSSLEWLRHCSYYKLNCLTAVWNIYLMLVETLFPEGAILNMEDTF